MMTQKLLGGLALAALFAASTAPFAEAAPRRAAAAPAPTAAAPAAQPAAQPLPPGPAIPGVCVYNNDEAIGTSTVGKAASARLQQLRAQVTAELQAEQTSIQTDGRALNAKKASLSAEQFQAQAAPINQRVSALERKAQQRQRELEATGQKALQRIGSTVTPILRAVYQQHSCSVLLRGEAVIAANQQMDLTPEVTQRLNQQMTTITFDREQLPAEQ